MPDWDPEHRVCGVGVGEMRLGVWRWEEKGEGPGVHFSFGLFLGFVLRKGGEESGAGGGNDELGTRTGGWTESEKGEQKGGMVHVGEHIGEYRT